MRLIAPHKSPSATLQATGWTWGSLFAQTPTGRVLDAAGKASDAAGKAADKASEALDTLESVAAIFAAIGIVGVGVWTYTKLR